jgi:hypothetical protein
VNAFAPLGIKAQQFRGKVVRNVRKQMLDHRNERNTKVRLRSTIFGRFSICESITASAVGITILE